MRIAVTVFATPVAVRVEVPDTADPAALVGVPLPLLLLPPLPLPVPLAPELLKEAQHLDLPFFSR